MAKSGGAGQHHVEATTLEEATHSRRALDDEEPRLREHAAWALAPAAVAPSAD